MSACQHCGRTVGAYFGQRRKRCIDCKALVCRACAHVAGGPNRCLCPPCSKKRRAVDHIKTFEFSIAKGDSNCRFCGRSIGACRRQRAKEAA